MGDLVCSVHDIGGNDLYYTFNGNSWNDDNSFGGTMVETGFKKNGTMVVSDVGKRPVWMFGGNVAGGMNLYSRAAPGWTLSLTNMKTVNGILSAHVTLDKMAGSSAAAIAFARARPPQPLQPPLAISAIDEDRNAPRRFGGAASARKARPDEVVAPAAFALPRLTEFSSAPRRPHA